MERHFPAQQTFVKRAASGPRGVAAAQHGEAARIGADVLAADGNAIDAAVAISFALGVIEPWMSGIGGGGFMVVREATGSVHSLDFGMRAPALLDTSAYPLTGGVADGVFPWPAVQDDRNLNGPLSIAVPSLVGGIGAAHQRWGAMSWESLLAPAAALAREGLSADWYATLLIGNAARRISGNPESARWLLPGGFPPSVANDPEAAPRIRHPRLAETLEAIRAEGPRSFTHGDVGAAVASDVEALGGWLRREDLSRCKAKLAGTLRIPCRGAQIHATPGLTGGPTIARAFRDLLRHVGPESTGTPGKSFYLSAALGLRNAFAHRLTHMGDSAEASTTSENAACTSHFSVVDKDGMAVAVTQTLLSAFGSAVTSRQTGVLLNNGLYWFDPRPRMPNSLGPRKRCLSNMCPLVIEGADGSTTAIGASGGRRIIAAVLQAAWFLIESGMSLEDALHYPRIDVSGDALIADSRLDPAICTALGEVLPVIRKPASIYPAWFANVSAARWHEGIAAGCVEPSLPWGEAISA